MRLSRSRSTTTLAATGLLAVAASLTLALPGAADAAAANPLAHPAAAHLQYLGEQELPFGDQFQGTTVGGLSAISYDRKNDRYYLISDDRSNVNPARFYTAKLALSGSGLAGVTLTGTHPWLQPDGSVFPKTVNLPGQPQTIAPDPEGIALNPVTGKLYWSSEGERITTPGVTPVLGDPWVREATTTGAYVRQLPLPPQLHMNLQQVGPRQNQTLEGLSFTPDGRQLVAAMEDPLYQDGADPTPTSGGLTRVTEYDASGVPSAQYAYPLSKFFSPLPAGDTGDTNGVSELLALGNGYYLVMERAVEFSKLNWTVRIFLASSKGATDTLGLDSLGDTKVTPLTKTLVLDLNAVKGLPRVDNVEGMTLGPVLPDGRPTLILVSDNNFNSAEVTQFIAFALSV